MPRLPSADPPGSAARTRADWTHREGHKGYSVTLYLRSPGGPIHARFQHPITKRLVRRSLGHTDRTRARQWAVEQAAKLLRAADQPGAIELPARRLSLAQLFGQYVATVTPAKKPDNQSSDRREVVMWTRLLGAGKDPHTVTVAELERFRRDRMSGVIDGRGQVIEDPDRRRPVRLRTVEHDVEWLCAVFNWAKDSRDPLTGQLRMQRNPLRASDFTDFWRSVHDANARQPVAGTDRYRAVRAVADQVLMEIRWHGKRERAHRSYLAELLDLAYHTGRRISAILALRWEHVLLGREYGKHGAIEWPAATDKEGKRWLQPMSPEVRAAIDRIRLERPGIGPALLFPSGSDPARPLRKETADAWLLAAEQLAQVPKHDGSRWHAYRRGWATARKHLPLSDVAAAGGWKSVETLVRHYIHPDSDTLLEVMMGAREIRERRA